MRLDVSGDDDAVGAGLVALVVTVLELLVEAMEREAVRRMEAGDLTDDEIERVGTTLEAVEAELARLKREEEVTEASDRLRAELDGLVEQALTHVAESDAGYAGLDRDPNTGPVEE